MRKERIRGTFARNFDQAAAGERVIALHDRIEAAGQPRRPNDMARQARGLWTRLGMAGFRDPGFLPPQLSAPPISQDDQSSGDTQQKGNRRCPVHHPMTVT